jgi:hypothetical protein
MADFNIDPGDFDFGFTTHSDDELVDAESARKGDEKAEKMFRAIMPLLNNLAKDADKNDIIKWPNRKDRIEKFIKQLNDILNS